MARDVLEWEHEDGEEGSSGTESSSSGGGS